MSDSADLPASFTGTPSWPLRRDVLIAGTTLLLTGCLRQPKPSYVRQPGVDSVVGGEAPFVPAPPPPVLIYEVQRGDTLASISRRSGVPIATIREANHLDSPLLQPGMRLNLPGAERMLPTAEIAPEDPGLPTGPYQLVPRSEWTDRKVSNKATAMGNVKQLVVHHTGEYSAWTGVADAEIVRRIERYHVEDRKWPAIGYHYLVGKDGRVYEGRPARFTGTHVRNHNSNNLAISVIGDFMAKPPSARQLHALSSFLDDSCARYRLGRAQVVGHRDLNSSDCPGDALYAWLKRYKARS